MSRGLTNPWLLGTAPPRRWPGIDRRSRLVFITRGVEREAVEASLRAFTKLGAGEPVTASYR
jgi:hypothetical protein